MITTFAVRRGVASYQVRCSGCGKLLTRKAVTECTVNPFNKNEDGTIKSSQEVSRQAQANAEFEAKKLAEKTALCRDCEEAPIRELLLEMNEEPDRVYPEPERYWGSPLHTLNSRNLVEYAQERCSCGSPCCSGFKRLGGYRLTPKGRERAERLAKKK